MSERLGPPPVEPMSDLAWARVERGLWARLDGTGPTAIATPGARRWMWLAAPAFAAAAGTAVYVGTRDEAPARPVAAAAPAGGEPTRVTTGAAPSTLSFGDAHVTLDAESAVVMSRAANGSTAVLERGAAWFAVAKRTQPFVVVAGDTVVRVVGTRFRVARFDERATVEVERGLVDVTFQGVTVQLGAGQRWTSLRPGNVEPVAPVPAPPPAAPASPASDDGARTDAAEPTAPVAAEPTTPAAPSPAPTTRPARRADPKTLAPAPAPAVDRDRAAYERLSATEARDPAGALAGYLALARGNGPWAELALYAAGRLAVDRGDPRATNLLTIYLRRFPRGANTDDARKLLDRLKGAP